MFEEVKIGDKTFRIRKQRSLLADDIIQGFAFKEGWVGKAIVIKADCEIYDRSLSKWRKITDEDLDNTVDLESTELVNKILELRKIEKDFLKTQQKKPKEKSGE